MRRHLSALSLQSSLHRFTEQSADVAGNAGISVGETLFSPNAATLTGGAGQDVLIAWGNETLTGGPGADRFVVDSNFTQRAITDFSPGTDVIELDGSVYHDFSTLTAHAQQSGANTVITVNGEVLTLQNVTLGSLSASDFMFV
jgi:Ca2+-binding RTX toxin-like protein